ncbi:hypothetical protein D915_004093 [Fasciola hepatica]|uniref:Uncharacterized protein n=1 Tax=Fasciola hepatica TaxID=6192 RepID=A0A4E0RFP8_FASHE|nr:hypothetical protein D915_004093 [Fasciola hepatica]
MKSGTIIVPIHVLISADFVIATRNLNGYLERLIRKIQWRQMARPNGHPVLWQVVSTERFLESMTRTMEKLHIVISLCVLSLGDNITEKLKSNAQSFEDVREEVLTNGHFLGTLREIIQEVDSISKRLLFQWINAPDSKMQFGRKTEYKIDFHADSGTLKSIVSNDPFRAEFITETNDLRKNLMSLLSVIHPGLPVKPNGRPYLGTTSGTV